MRPIWRGSVAMEMVGLAVGVGAAVGTISQGRDLTGVVRAIAIRQGRGLALTHHSLVAPKLLDPTTVRAIRTRPLGGTTTRALERVERARIMGRAREATKVPAGLNRPPGMATTIATSTTDSSAPNCLADMSGQCEAGGVSVQHGHCRQQRGDHAGHHQQRRPAAQPLRSQRGSSQRRSSSTHGDVHRRAE
jgi:hypothetical protein